MRSRWLAVMVASLSACARAEGALPLGASASDCASCHAEQAEAFASSPHARSDRSPVLEALRARVATAWGDRAAGQCDRCHAPAHVPAAMALGEPDPGVTCVSCHAAIGNRGERDGLLLVDPSAPTGGPFADPEPTGAHASRQSTLLASASLCGTCHEVTGPSLFVEETLTEHRAASPLPDDPSCAGCHMPRREEGPIATGASRDRARRDHGFVGLDPPWGQGPEAIARATEASARLVGEALALAIVRDETGLVVSVSNVGARHAVPTGVAFLRDVWIDVEIERASGKQDLLARVIELGDRPMRGQVPVALPTDADRIEHRRLDFGQTRCVTLEVGGDVVRARARLRARAFRQDVLEALALGPRSDEVPVLEAAYVDWSP